ncbi:hypothetical protein Ae201684_015085 [Aphanomyces euteiches]|uniref:Uncharacterized protein n=1 Tax=Aphanomyces euteiches TaxID=100861 RepID=A0A6G0WHL0_9STRA|nr:hypothetical protein Ae201684_015085 [Aphanomyces euteiches]
MMTTRKSVVDTLISTPLGRIQYPQDVFSPARVSFRVPSCPPVETPRQPLQLARAVAAQHDELPLLQHEWIVLLLELEWIDVLQQRPRILYVHDLLRLPSVQVVRVKEPLSVKSLGLWTEGRTLEVLQLMTH